MPTLVPHPEQTRRRRPQSGKQRKAQLRAERQRREAPVADEDDDNEAEAQREAVVREYHTDERGYRWRRAAAEASAVLVGMVVQRARGGGVIIRLSLVPGTASAAPSAATAAADPAQSLAVERLQRRMKALQSDLSGFTRFKPSQVGGQRWENEATKWATAAQRVAAVAADPGVATALGTSPAAATELFLLLQHALQAGPLAGAQPAKFKPLAAACRQVAERAGGEASDLAQHPFAQAAAAVLDGAVGAAGTGVAFSAKQLDTIDAWRKGFAKAFGLEGTPTEQDGLVDESDIDGFSGVPTDHGDADGGSVVDAGAAALA